MSLFKKTKYPSEPHVTEHKDAILFLFLAPINHKGIKQHIAEVFCVLALLYQSCTRLGKQ